MENPSILHNLQFCLFFPFSLFLDENGKKVYSDILDGVITSNETESKTKTKTSQGKYKFHSFINTSGD